MVENSLVCAYLLDGNGAGKKLTWDTIDHWQPSDGILWVHLNSNQQRSRQWLNKKSGLSKLIIREMLSEDSRPHCTSSHDGLLVSLRGINIDPNEEPQDMVSIRIWIDGRRIITTQEKPIASIRLLEQSFADNCAPRSPSEFLRILNDRMLDQMSDVIDKIDETVDDLEEEIIHNQSYLLRPKIANTRRSIVIIRRYLAPQREAINKLFSENYPLIDDGDRSFIRDSFNRITRYIEDLDSARERAAITQEELSSRLSEQMDRRMYVLSVVAVIFLPLTFITGLLGINVGGIPGSHYRWAFLIVCGICLGILVMTPALLKRLRWL